MQRHLLMTVIGPDRPGIMESLSALVVEMDGNWQESRMSHLGGHFAGVVLLAIPTDNVEPFREKLTEVASHGLVCTVQDAVADETERGACYALEIVGNDRPGIVRAITDVIAQAGGNVEQFTSGVESAPMSGDQLFKAEIKVCFSEDAAVEGLEDRFAALGDELMLDVNWHAAGS